MINLFTSIGAMIRRLLTSIGCRSPESEQVEDGHYSPRRKLVATPNNSSNSTAGVSSNSTSGAGGNFFSRYPCLSSSFIVNIYLEIYHNMFLPYKGVAVHRGLESYHIKQFMRIILLVGIITVLFQHAWESMKVGYSEFDTASALTPRVYADKVMDVIKHMIVCDLAEHNPVLLMHHTEITKGNNGVRRRLGSGNNKYPNPDWLTVTLRDEKCDEIIRRIANKVWNDQDIVAIVRGIECTPNDMAKNYTAITSEEDLIRCLKTDAPSRNGNMFQKFLTRDIRRGYESQYEKAQGTEAGIKGPFRGTDKDVVRPQATIDKEKKKIINLVKDCVTGMSEPEAKAVLVEFLFQFSMEHLQLDVQQMTALVVEYVMCNNDLRKVEIDAEIEELREAAVRNGAGRRKLARQELNEVIVHLDYIIKIKANINQAIELLKDGRAIVLELYDEEFEDYIIDIYVLAPADLKYELCQGQAKKQIGSYKAYKGHRKMLPKNRYLVGLFLARVFDLQSQVAILKVGGRESYGALLPNGNIMREILYTIDDNTFTRKLMLDNPEGKKHCFTLHRFVLIVASCYGCSIFEKGALAKLGIKIPEGCALDEFLTYHYPRTSNSKEAARLKNALRVDKAHSKQCDGDHRMGRDRRFYDGILFCLLTSHRMNICFIYMRTEAGHWCCGLVIMPYDGGLVTDYNSMEYFPALDDLTFPTPSQIRSGTADTTALDDLPRLDFLTILPRVEAPWDISDEVDCYCARLGGEKCDVCKQNVIDGRNVVKDEVVDFEDDEDDENEHLEDNEDEEKEDTKMSSRSQEKKRRSPLGNNSSQEEDTKIPSLLHGRTRRVHRSLRSPLGNNSSEEEEENTKKKRRVDTGEEQGGGGEEADVGNGEAGAAEAAGDVESTSSVSSGIPSPSRFRLRSLFRKRREP